MSIKSLTALTLLLGATLAAQAQTTTLSFSAPQGTGAHNVAAAAKFAELVRKNSAGRLDVKINPAGADNALMMKEIRSGALDITANSQGVLAKEVPEFAALGLPFLFATDAKAWQVLDGPVGRELTDLSAAKGLVVLAYWDNGIRQMTNNKRPITKPEDLKGLKFRTPPDPVTVEIMNAFGAEAAQIKFSETHGAISAGVVDGQENPLVNIDGGKFFEVQPYLSLTSHKYEAMPVVMSKAGWEKLSAADRKAVADAIKEATTMQRKGAKDANDALLTGLQAKGMKVNKVDTAAFVKASQPIVDKWRTSETGPFVGRLVAAAH